MIASKPQTMFEKIWDQHVVHHEPGKQTILYIDLHLVHEVTSPQAFKGLRLTGRKPWQAGSMLTTLDHDVPMTAAEKFTGRGRHKRSSVENTGADMR